MNYSNINSWLSTELEKLDISPSNYKLAVDRYTAVGNLLENKLREEHGIEAHIYAQGSFMIGTVVKPYGKNKEYDIDLVCECDIEKQKISPQELKKTIGDILKDSIYKDMLDDEGRRTWTIEYSENNDLGFHIDIQPCVPTYINTINTEISTTTRDKTDANKYYWDKGNPKEFKVWFEKINKASFDTISYNYKKRMFESNQLIFASIEDVPDQLVRTQLQRMIQILKRHRDIRFEKDKSSDDKPNSMIITILATKIYNTLPPTASLYELLKELANQLESHKKLLTENNNDMELLLISRRSGKYYIINPVVDENLAEKWNIDGNGKKEAFFKWCDWVSQDVAKLATGMINDYETRTIDVIFNILKTNTSVSSTSNSNQVKSIEDPVKPWRDE